jgi:hypothetical protein
MALFSSNQPYRTLRNAPATAMTWERPARGPRPKEFMLNGPRGEWACFVIDGEKATVRRWAGPVIRDQKSMTRVEARAEYRKLLNAGWTKW